MGAVLNWRFAWLDMERTELLRGQLSSGTVSFSIITDKLFMVATCGFSLLFVISPFTSVWGHSLPFIVYIVVRFLVVAANLNEHPHIERRHKVFLAVYGMVSFMLVGFFVTNYVAFDLGYGGSLIPWWVTASFDYGWFICLFLTSFFIPRAQLIELTHKYREVESCEA